MKKIWLLTALLIGSLLLVWCDNTITTENLSETTQKQSYNFFNDYSELDRSIISWSITYDECVENWWEVTEEDLGWESKVYTCNDWNHDYLKYDFWAQRNTISKTNYEAPDYEIWTDNSTVNNERYVFNLDSQKNSQLIEILWRIPLPDSYQNSLIELFALTWNQVEYKNPNIENDINLESNWVNYTSEWSDFDISFSSWELIIKPKKDNLEGNYYLYWEKWEKVWINDPDITSESYTDLLLNNLWNNQRFIVKNRKNVWWEYNSKREYVDTDNYIAFDSLTYEDLWFHKDYCIKWICFNWDEPIQYYKWRYYQSSENPENEHTKVILYNEEYRIWILLKSDFMTENTQYVLLTDEYTLESFRYDACTILTINQIITPKSDFNFPNTINILWEEYTLQPLSNLIDSSVESHNEYGFIRTISTIFSSVEEAENIINSSVLKTKNIYNTYVFRIKDYPNIWLTYSNTSNTENPQAIMLIDSDLKVDEDWNLTDLDQTISVLCGLWLDDYNWECKREDFVSPITLQGMLFFDEEKEKNFDYREWVHSWDKQPILNEKMLPIFRVEPVKEINGNYYYVYGAEWVVFTNWGYWCKPVIYVYDSQNRENSVSISLPESAKFTKVIPDFTSNNIWKFSTDNESNISVEGQNYPYLYYSTLRKDYDDNGYWWTVSYDDLENFLNNKLDYINFNEKEKSDFLEYWLPEFKPWYVYSISFKFNEQFEPYAKLDFEIKPDKIFRVFMEAHQLPNYRNISFSSEYSNAWNDKYLKRFERWSEYDILEWWGKLDLLK